MQEDAGLQSATDGEFRRASWHMDFIYQLDGVTKAADDLVVRFHNPEGDIEFTAGRTGIGGKIDVHEPIFGEHFSSSRTPRRPRRRS